MYTGLHMKGKMTVNRSIKNYPVTSHRAIGTHQKRN